MSAIRRLAFLSKGFRYYCQKQNVFKVLSYNEVRQEIQKPSTILLDVREKGELSTDGKIPQGKNIPIGEVAKALVLDPESFEEQYGFPKPTNDENIVVHCKAGVRAELAAKAMKQLGYTNIKVYSGIKDWKENGGETS